MIKKIEIINHRWTHYFVLIFIIVKTINKMKRLVLILLLLGSLLSATHAKNSYSVEAQLEGGPGDPVFGDLAGTANVLISEDDSPTGNARSIIGAVYADGNLFPNGTAMPHAGRTYYYENTVGHLWSQFQPQYVGQSAYNQNGPAVDGGQNGGHGGGHGGGHHGGHSHKHADGWLFVSEAGNPLNVSDPAIKIRSGNINVFKLVNDNYVLYQRIPNPNGDGPDQNHAEFGISLDYSNGWLIAGGGITNTAWLISYDDDTNLWVPRQSVVTGTQKGNLIVAIGGDYAFIQVALDFSVIVNEQVLVYKRTGQLTWTYHQTLQGFSNTGSNMSFIGDLFGSPMTIGGKDNRWAVLGAPGDGTKPGTTYAGMGGANYFAYLQNNGYWQVTQKDFSSSPTLFYGFGNCINGNVAFVSDPGRTVGSNDFQGAQQEYRLVGQTWQKRSLLTDPNGRAYDYFGPCSITRDHLQIASFRAATQFLPFPELIGPALPGRIVIWKRT